MRRLAAVCALSVILLLTACLGPATTQLTGDQWTVSSVLVGTTLTKTADAPQTMTLQFASDGTAVASTGVNTANWTYDEGTNGELRMWLASITLRGSNDHALQLEAAYVAALERVSRYQMTDTELHLLDSDGTTLVVLVS